MTVAGFMDLALYDPELGYYARAGRRSGRAGDFFTSVDVGPLFGELLAVQIAEMAQLLRNSPAGRSAAPVSPNNPAVDSAFDLVEAGAGCRLILTRQTSPGRSERRCACGAARDAGTRERQPSDGARRLLLHHLA